MCRKQLVGLAAPIPQCDEQVFQAPGQIFPNQFEELVELHEFALGGCPATENRSSFSKKHLHFALQTAEAFLACRCVPSIKCTNMLGEVVENAIEHLGSNLVRVAAIGYHARDHVDVLGAHIGGEAAAVLEVI